MKAVPLLALLLVAGIAAYFAFGRRAKEPEQPLSPAPATLVEAAAEKNSELSRPTTSLREEAVAPPPTPAVKPRPVPAPGEPEWEAEFKAMSTEERLQRHAKLRGLLDERLQIAFDAKLAENQVQVVSGGMEEDPRSVAERQTGPGQLGWAVRRDIDKKQGVGNYWFARIDPSEDHDFQVLHEQVDWLVRNGATAPK